MKILICSLLMLTGSFALADDTKCVSGTDERVLSLSEVETGCKLEYTKAGTTSSLATQKNGKTKCEEVRDTVKSKLEGAGYQCRIATADAATK